MSVKCLPFQIAIMSEQKNSLYLLKLWYQPGSTIRGLLETQGGHGLALMVAALLGFIVAARFYFSESDGGGQYFVIGAVLGVFGLYLFSWLLRNFARWFGGQAQVREVRTGLGLSLLPYALFFAILFGATLFLGAETVEHYFWLFFIGLLYGYVIILLSLSAALRLSILKTFLCLIVTFIVSIFPLTLMLQLMFPQLVPAQ